MWKQAEVHVSQIAKNLNDIRQSSREQIIVQASSKAAHVVIVWYEADANEA